MVTTRKPGNTGTQRRKSQSFIQKPRDTFHPRVRHAEPLVRCANRRLRAAILGIADNPIVCNQHIRILAAQWRVAGKNPGLIHIKVAPCYETRHADGRRLE
jgi:hypothetical protein